METEIWKDIPGYEWLYLASHLWNIKSIGSWTEKILKITYDKKSYGRVFLWKNREWKPFLVHRIISFTFIENVNKHPQVNHIDGDRKNNTVTNLEWVTHSENALHSFRVLSRKISDKNKEITRVNNRIRATPVIKYSLNWDFIGEYRSIWDIWLWCPQVWRAIKERKPYKWYYFAYKWKESGKAFADYVYNNVIICK